VIIMTDQQRADLSGREGFALDTTPFLDTLAREGVWFNRAYTAAPVCGPARVSLLTGRFPSVHRVCVNHGLHLAHYTQDIVDVMKGQGYATALVGKNHSHLSKDRMDLWAEFGHSGSIQQSQDREEKAFDKWLKELNHGVGLEPAPFPLRCQIPYRAVSHAMEWIHGLAGTPFFLWLSLPEPHTPYQAPEPYFSFFDRASIPPVGSDEGILARKGFKWTWTKRLGEYVYPDYDELLPRARADYLGMLRLIDDQILRFVRFLEEEGLMEETYIVFLSDHGDFVGEYGLMRKGPEIPEVLIRIPLIFRGPGIAASQEASKAFVSTVDIMPTFCELIGVDIPPGVQGRSLAPILTGGAYPEEEFASVYAEQGFGGLHYSEQDELSFNRDVFPGPKGPTFDCLNSCSQSGIMRMLRKGDWKLIYDMQGRGQLYDVSRDPLETMNLFGKKEYQSVLHELLPGLLTWCLRVQDPLVLPDTGRYVMKRDPRNYWSPYVE
jgi:arylsulfatase A-like enzyme